MDVETAIIHRQGIQTELEIIRAYRPHFLPIATKLLAIEIARLDHTIPTQYMRSVTDVSKIKIPVENPFMMLQVTLDFELGDLSSIMNFINKLHNEISEIEMFEIFNHQLPVTARLTQRVIELLQDEIRPESERSELEAGWKEYVDMKINEALDAVIKRDPRGGNVLNVIYHMLGDPTVRFRIDDNIRSLIAKRHFEATLPLKSKPAPEVVPRRRSRL